MKKLITALLVCSLITVSFASCNLNSKKKDDSSSKSSSSESADNSDSKSSDKDSSSKSSDKDSSTADVSVAANDSTIDQASTEPATVSTEFTTLKKGQIDKSIVGSWTSDDLGGATIVLTKDGSVGAKMDYSSMMYFSNGKLMLQGKECETTFDGSKISATADGNDILVIERTGKSDKSSMDGEYKLTGGQMYTSMAGSMPESTTITMNIAGEKLNLTMNDLCTYASDNGTIEVINDNSHLLTTSDGNSVSTYKLDGTTLTLTSADNNVITLNKAE